MRGPTPDRPVVRILPGNAPRGLGNLYRIGYVELDRLCPVPAVPTSHLHDRTGTINRPVVRVTPTGRLYHTWYGGGRFHIQAIA